MAWLLYGTFGAVPPAPAPARPAAAPLVAAAPIGESWRTLPPQDQPLGPPERPPRRRPPRPAPDADRIIDDTQGRVSVMSDVDADVQAERDAQIGALGPDQRGGTYYAPPEDSAELALLPQDLNQPHYAGGRAAGGLGVGAAIGGRGTSSTGGGRTSFSARARPAPAAAARSQAAAVPSFTPPPFAAWQPSMLSAVGSVRPGRVGGAGTSSGGGRGTSFGSGGTTAPRGPSMGEAPARAADRAVPLSMTASLRGGGRGSGGGGGAGRGGVNPGRRPADAADRSSDPAGGDGLFTEPPLQNSDGSWEPGPPLIR